MALRDMRNVSAVVLIAVFFFVAALVLPPRAALASTTNGTIDSASKYAWGEKIGWLNFGTSGGNVHVTDSALTGYAWSDNYGWVNLAPQGSGVTNNGEGDLSGQAWGENLGYVDFSNVSINSSGVFGGTASGTNTGAISFTCTNCAVVTDWRPASSRTTPGSGSAGSSGGGGGAPAPLGVTINGNGAFTPAANVTLTITTDGTITDMMVSNFPDFRDAVREPYRGNRAWNICNINGAPAAGCPSENGVYTVYVRFISNGGTTYGPYADSILYATTPPGPEAPAVPPPTGPASPTGPPGTASLLDQLYDFLEPLIPDFLKPKPEPVGEPSVIAPEAPLAFRGDWNLLPESPIREFVFAPLSREFLALVEKFPALARIVREVGIAREADLRKLYGISLALPGFTGTSLERSFEEIAAKPAELQRMREVVLKLPGFSPAALPGAPRIARVGLALPPGIPLAALPLEIKEGVPSDVIFARVGNEKIDLDISVRLNEMGDVEQRISTVSGSILKLVVRPSAPAKRVLGYLTFASRTRAAATGGGNMPRGVSLQGMLGSIVFNAPSVSAPQPDARITFLNKLASFVDTLLGRANDTSVEERLALREFEYTDADGDGLYTAVIQAPVVDGEYAVYTVIDYLAPELASREIKLITVVDPEGYVYEEFGGRETRIPGAVASLYWLNPATKDYELWPADDYAQENPQVTDVRGTYAFLVPPGWYYLKVAAPGFDAHEGRPFEVKAGESGVHTNIELRSPYGFLRRMDWKTTLLVLVTLLLIYNFYRDRRRLRAAA